jgi:hypothetical protein
VFSDDVDAGQNLTIDYDQSIPGSTFSSNGAQHPVGTFCWTPATSNVSNTPYCFTITVHDDNCPYIGSQTYSYCLTVIGIVANAGPDQFINCATVATISASGSGGNPPYTYLWSNGSTAQSVSVGVGTYILTVSDGTCTDQDTINITNVPTPVINSIPVVDVLCNGGNNGSITVNVSSGTAPYQFSIDNGTTFQSGNIFNNLPAGTYNIVITDANGCQVSTTVNITEPTPLVVNPNSTTSTCVLSNGTITINASGGTGAIQYSIDNGATYQAGNVFSNLATGNYNIVVQDANGCLAASSIAVATEPSPVIINTPSVNVSCNSGTNGSITINFTALIMEQHFRQEMFLIICRQGIIVS